MKRHRAQLAGAILCLAQLVGCEHQDPPFTVFGATSLRLVLEDLQRDPGLPQHLAFHLASGASQTMARQIASGARADLLLSADEAWVLDPGLAHAFDASSRSPIASNRLAVVMQQPATDEDPRLHAAHDLLAMDRISVADPLNVPLGRYTQAWLESEGLWNQVQPRCASAFDSRMTLAAVASGAQQAGVVYFSDARASKKVQIQFVVEGERAPLIRYVAVLPRASANSGRALELVRFLRGPTGLELLQKHGFLPPPEP